MTAIQMRLAVSEIYSGKSYEQSVLPKNDKNRAQWLELSEEIQLGYKIDPQYVRIRISKEQ